MTSNESLLARLGVYWLSGPPGHRYLSKSVGPDWASLDNYIGEFSLVGADNLINLFHDAYELGFEAGTETERTPPGHY